MAASLQAAATLMQPTKVGVVPARSSSLQLRSSQSVSKAFGVDSAGARISCSLNNDLKDLAQKCVDATKIAGFALATSALVVSVCLSSLTMFSFCFYLLLSIIIFLVHMRQHNDFVTCVVLFLGMFSFDFHLSTQHCTKSS